MKYKTLLDHLTRSPDLYYYHYYYYYVYTSQQFV